MDELKKRFRKWHIVLFDELATFDSIFDTLTKHKTTHYCIIGEELAPTTKVKHFHLYCEFDNACTFESLKKIFPTAHIEKANGTSSQNKAYITKDGNYKEYGIPTPIKYSADDSALNIVEFMRENPDVDLFEIALSCPEFSDYIVRNYRSLNEILHDIRRKIENEEKEFNRQIGYEIENPKGITF